MKNALSIACAAVIVLSISSCSIEKRIHNKGYHISWRGHQKTVESKRHQDKLESEVESVGFNPKEMQAPNHLSAELKHEQEAKFVQEVQSKEKFNKQDLPISNSNLIAEKDPSVSQNYMHLNSQKSEVNTPKSKLEQKHAASNSEGGSGLSILGGILIGLGLVLLLFVSFLIGIILLLVGLAFVIGGSAVKKNNVQSEPKSKELQDVVYLKNGSVIRGVIIEQVPNVQVKIKTSDGSIFVFKMEEIDKMTKEEMVK